MTPRALLTRCSIGAFPSFTNRIYRCRSYTTATKLSRSRTMVCRNLRAARKKLRAGGPSGARRELRLMNRARGCLQDKLEVGKSFLQTRDGDANKRSRTCLECVVLSNFILLMANIHF